MENNKSIALTKINRLIKTYNITMHQTTEESPAQMEENKVLEVMYIIESINKQK
jgi:hypothetical protein